MDQRKRRDIFLATCLLESIEDENYLNTRKLLIEHNANANLLIPESNIAPIHYAAGMENTDFAEAAMKLILKYNGNPNVQTIDGETPLHIAVIWNRTLIVKMLLDHGGDLSISDNDNNTPISHAITEKHYNLIPIFQKYVFEQKIQKKYDSAAQLRHDRTPNKAIDTIAKSFQQMEITKTIENDKLLTPNRTNFNFNEASPYLVNINTRRPKYKKIDAAIKKSTPENKLDGAIIVISDSDNEDVCEHNVVRNLFALTEENIEKHLSTVVKKSRKDSLITLWRNRVNESRQRKSMLPICEKELDVFFSDNTEGRESSRSVETVVPAKPKSCHENETDDSFITAVDQNGETVVIESKENERDAGETIFQTEEVYEHFDPELNIIFYENKLLAKPVKMSPKAESDNEYVLSTSLESGTCTDLLMPTDYDTDDLRKELKAFGEAPGPITKNTKRLYLKKLVRYKRRPQQALKQGMKCNFSVELQKTMRADSEPQYYINDYMPLERQMTGSFQGGAMKNMREGNLKKSFIYLLIDPRIAENLLAESQVISPNELWCRFLRSIFYVGKGKSSRPFAHLYDAIKIYNDKGTLVDKLTKYHESVKLDRIIDIWRCNKGVICLPVFHNITPVEAYTREAAIIDCLGVENLTNIKRGDYYGISKSWTMRDRKRLGVLLLYKAMQVFMVEGESQLRPNDIV